VRTKNVNCLLFVAMLCLIGCTASPTPAQPTTDDPATTVSPTTLPLPTQTADQSPIDPLITSLTAAGATVVNNGRTEQGLFPAEGIGLWHLTVNGTSVDVYEFSDTAAREAVSSNISPRGDEYTVTEGDTTVTII
jgi:hypothetical protein